MTHDWSGFVSTLPSARHTLSCRVAPSRFICTRARGSLWPSLSLVAGVYDPLGSCLPLVQLSGTSHLLFSLCFCPNRTYSPLSFLEGDTPTILVTGSDVNRGIVGRKNTILFSVCTLYWEVRSMKVEPCLSWSPLYPQPQTVSPLNERMNDLCEFTRKRPELCIALNYFTCWLWTWQHIFIHLTDGQSPFLVLTCWTLFDSSTDCDRSEDSPDFIITTACKMVDVVTCLLSSWD